jgi:hypothetical protein
MSTLAKKVLELFGKPEIEGFTIELRERIRPHISPHGELIIPFASDPKYHWWDGGQSIAATLRELNAPPEAWARYVDSDVTLRVRQ